MKTKRINYKKLYEEKNASLHSTAAKLGRANQQLAIFNKIGIVNTDVGYEMELKNAYATIDELNRKIDTLQIAVRNSVKTIVAFDGIREQYYE